MEPPCFGPLLELVNVVVGVCFDSEGRINESWRALTSMMLVFPSVYCVSSTREFPGKNMVYSLMNVGELPTLLGVLSSDEEEISRGGLLLDTCDAQSRLSGGDLNWC